MFFWVFFLCFVTYTTADLNGDCSLDGVTTEQWVTAFNNEPKNDNEDSVFKIFNTKNVASVSLSSSPYNKYFSVNYLENVLTVAPSAEFANFENNENHEENPTMSIALILKCNSGNADLSFFQPINDLNTHNPYFLQESYSYELPTPLPADFNLQCLTNSAIEACDLDITNTKLTFEINPPGHFAIELGTPTDESKKCHNVIIKTTKPLSLNETTTYELTAIDIGGNQGKATMEIKIDEKNAVPPNPQFSSAYYTATYDNSNEQHEINFDGLITLEKNDPVPSVTISGEYSTSFTIDLSEGVVTVTLVENLPQEVIDESVIVILTLEAKIENAVGPGRTAIVVYMPKKECPTTTTAMPTTACPTTETPTECPICPTETTTVCPPCTTESTLLTTACPTTEAPTECPTETTTVCPPCTTESTELTTACPTTETPTECPICPTESTTMCPPCTTEPTECPICTTEVTTVSTPCTTETTILTSECPICTTEASTECPISTAETLTECPVCPTECPSSTTEFTSCPPCTTETTSTTCPSCTTTTNGVTECPPCTCSSTTTSVTDDPLSTSPSTEGSSESTLSTSSGTEGPTSSTAASCPPCTTPTDPPTGSRVDFLQDLYQFNTLSADGVTVGVVKAIATPSEEIKYSIEPNGENDFPSSLEINEETGALTLSGEVDVGLYRIIARAQGKSSGVETTTQVEINVYTTTDTTNVLIVRTIEENTTTSIPLPCPNGENTCIYEFIDQYPQTEDVLFKVENGNLVTEAISLQRSEIKDLFNPQYTINLKLTNMKNIEALDAEEENARHWLYLPENIPRDPGSLLVSVVIKDVNDHSPVFEAGSKLIVGYPVQSLLNVLSPPYLVQVRATDLDRGVYADIRYTTTDENFVIHPKTGVVYPGDNAFNSNTNTEFSVVATDMDGADGGKSSTLNIAVKLLTEEYLSFLTMENKLIEDLDDELKELSSKTNLKINYLLASVIPEIETESFSMLVRKLTSANEDYAIKLTIYALDDNDEPVPSSTLQGILEETEDVGDLTTTSWSPADNAVTDVTGYIAAIGVLASLLVLFIITVGVLYYLKIYKKRNPKIYDTMTEEDSESTKSDKPQLKEVEEKTKRRPTGYVFNVPPPEEDSDVSDERKYESVPNKGWTDNNKVSDYDNPIDFKQDDNNYTNAKFQTKDDDEKDSQSSNSVEYENPSRKSVSFRPIVEKINIIVDDEKQDDDENVDVRF